MGSFVSEQIRRARAVDIVAAVVLMGLMLCAGLASCTKGQDGVPQLSKAGKGPVEQADAATEDQRYTCPMHPSVISDKPGACPICGMTLVKRMAPEKASVDELGTIRGVSLSATQRVLANVATTQVGRVDIDKEIEAVGVVDFAEPLQAVVTARFNGRVEDLLVDFTGAQVRRGQPLYELHSPDLVSAEQELILTLNALDNPGPSGQDPNQLRMLEAARDRLRVHFGMTDDQIAQVETSRKARLTATIFSPISGTVVGKEIQQGQYVTEGMPLYQLADLSRVWIYLDVYERDVSHIKLGHPVRITSESYPYDVFTGSVTFVDPVIDSATRTVRVRTESTNPEGKLKPKMYVQARIHVPSRQTLTVPRSAVLNTGRRDLVWVEVKENQFEPRDVKLGTSSGESVEVLDGLREGDTIVTSGGFLIDSESQLQTPGGGSAIGHQHGTSESGLPADPGSQPSPTPGSGASTGRERTIPRGGERASEPPGGSHSGHGLENVISGDAATATGAAVPAVREGGHAGHGGAADRTVRVVVDNGYAPDVIDAKLGERLTLAFERHSASTCTEEVVFEDFNIRRELPLHQTTTINITPEKAGEYPFTCGMGMLRGTVVVHE